MKNASKVKTIQRVAGMIAILTVIAFSLLACDNDSGPSLKEGRYICQGSNTLYMILSGGNRVTLQEGTSRANGTYTITGDRVIFTFGSIYFTADIMDNTSFRDEDGDLWTWAGDR